VKQSRLILLGVAATVVFVLLALIVKQLTRPLEEELPVAPTHAPTHAGKSSGTPLPLPASLPEATVAEPIAVVTPPAPPQPAPHFRTWIATNQVTLARGETLVVGGWVTTPGKRTCAFIQPEVSTQDNTVIIRSHFIDIPDASLTSPAWQPFTAAADKATATGVISPENIDALMKELTDKPDLEVLSAPTITTLDGHDATIQIGQETRDPTTGTNVLHGLRFKVKPIIDATTGAVTLTTELEFNAPVP
jgi:hypothetical protein